LRDKFCAEPAEAIQFVSAVDSKPITPSYLKLMTLKQFSQMVAANKQNGPSSISSPVKRQQSNQSRFIVKTQLDHVIQSLQGCKMLNNELKSCIDKWVAEPIEPSNNQPLSIQQQAVQKYREAR
jgi:hypothetical protein